MQLQQQKLLNLELLRDIHVPKVLLSDNAAEFTSELLRKLCEFYEINKCQITAYKPSSNGAVERTNRKIKDILKTLVKPNTEDWDLALEDVQFTINNTVNETVGESPHYLLYGYEKRLPNTLLDDATPPRHTYNYDDYIAWKTRRTYETIKQTRTRLKEAQSVQAKYYDKNTAKPKIVVGAQVYVQNHVPEGPNVKVSAKFQGPYRVLEVLKLNKLKIISESDLKERIVHTNHVKVIKTDSWSNKRIVELLKEVEQEPINNKYNLRKR